jgi:MoaA/NifB/PqqE/SkfB family radical SAM enzyme
MAVEDVPGMAPQPAGRERWAAWQIELTTRCPLACRMCIRQGPDPWSSRDMSVEEFAGLAGQLQEVDTVVLQGWGEPLLHGHLVEIVRLAKSAGRPASCPARAPRSPAVGFVTSGKGLDRRYAAELVGAGLDFVGFSLAGVTPATHSAIRVRSQLEDVTSAAEHVEAVKRRQGRRSPRTHVVFLMLEDNIGELPDLPALARRMGAEEIVLTNLIHVVDSWQERQKVFGRGERSEYDAILDETERRARACHVAVRRPSLCPSPTAVCEEDPLRNLYVGVEGEVSPCVYLGPPLSREFTRRFGERGHRVEKVSFGNAFREPVSAIWDHPAYASFRARFAGRARRRDLRCFVPSSWRARTGSSRGEALPDPPDPCSTCHKLLGV